MKLSNLKLVRFFVLGLLFIALWSLYFCFSKNEQAAYFTKSLSYLTNRFVLNKEYLVAKSDYGVKFKFKTPDAVGRTIYKDGIYESEITNFVLKDIKYGPNDIVIDIGANIGWYSLLLDHLKNGPVVIYSFEPDSLNYSLFKNNIKLNNASKVIAINSALSDKRGESTLYKYKDTNLGRHSMLPIYDGKKEQVSTVTLDGFMQANHIAGPIKLVKIDVEGFEGPVLLGAKETLGRIENLILELSQDIMQQQNIDSKQVVQMLYDNGFNPYAFADQGVTPLSKADVLQSKDTTTLLWKK